MPIGRAADPRHRLVNGPGAAPARSHFAVLGRAGERALLALAPVTGRTHQLRVHAAHAGAPLLGDRVYGAPSASANRGAQRPPGSLVLPSGKVLPLGRIALHAARVTVPRRDGTPWVVTSEAPEELLACWCLLGGERFAWDTAVSCALSSG